VFFGASGSAIWLIALGAWLATRLNISDGLVGLQKSGDNVAAPLGSVTAFLSATALLATMGVGAALDDALHHDGGGKPLHAGQGAELLVPQARLEMETNYFGTLRTCQAFAPVLAAERRAGLVAAVSALPDRERQVLVCRYFLDLSEAETAQVLACPLGSVKSRTWRALNRLRGLLLPDQQTRISSG
jgi:NAD(P)-dependent dehydrogenase (short-subunit alcohol dehydrogenase family)